MIVDIEMPHQGLTLTEATLLRWLKAPGETVVKDEGLFEIETEKAVQEMPSPVAGTVFALLAQEGDIVPLGDIVAQIETEEIDAGDRASAMPSAQADAPVYVPEPVTIPAEFSAGEVSVSPRAKRAAKQHAVDLASVTATGAGGQHIVERDVLARVAEQPAAAIPAMSRVRRITAERTTASFREAPHFYLTREVVVDRLLEFRQALLADLGEQAPVRVSLTDCLVKAVALALSVHPAMNRQWQDEQIVEMKSTDIGLAVDTPQGLLVPVLRDMVASSLLDIAVQRQRFVHGAQAGQLSTAEMTGGSMTLSNLGALGIDQFHAIINPPQSAILAVGAARLRPVVVEGQLCVANTLFLTLAVDHRVADGADAARFLQSVVDLLAHPLRLCCAPTRREGEGG